MTAFRSGGMHRRRRLEGHGDRRQGDVDQQTTPVVAYVTTIA
jgi:hypothetical protein